MEAITKKTSVRITYNGIIAALFMFLSPLLALPYILTGVYQRRKSAFLLFSLFWGFLAWLQVPLMDLYRHNISFFAYENLTLAQVLNGQEADFVIPILKWLLVNNGLPFQILRLFEAATSVYLMSVIFNYMIRHSPRYYTKGEIFKRFWIMILFMEFIQMVSGVRYGFALFQYVFAIHLFINKKQYFWSILFAFMASQTHNSFTYLIPISTILYIACRSKKLSIGILCCLLVFGNIFVSVFSHLWESRAEWYFEGGNSLSGNTFADLTIFGILFFIVIRMFLIPFGVLALRYISPVDKWTRITTVWVILALTFIVNAVMLFRMCYVLATIGIFCLLAVESKRHLSRRLVNLILFCGIMTTLINGMNYRDIILNSRFQYIAAPIPIIVSEQYEYTWIINHIDNNRVLGN